jgi:hypothetical protein
VRSTTATNPVTSDATGMIKFITQPKNHIIQELKPLSPITGSRHWRQPGIKKVGVAAQASSVSLDGDGNENFLSERMSSMSDPETVKKMIAY